MRITSQIPDDSRFKTSEIYKDTVKELESEAGKAKIAKMRKLGDLAKRLGASNQAALALAWAAKNQNVSYVSLSALIGNHYEFSLLTNERTKTGP